MTDNQSHVDQSKREEAYYSALIEAWISTRIEKDRSLLTIAAAGIGLLVTVLSTVGSDDGLQAWLYAASFLFFLLTIITVIMVFHRNAPYIEHLLAGSTKEGDHTFLRALDYIATFSFLAGILAAALIGFIRLIK